jgi:hypothetical protein
MLLVEVAHTSCRGKQLVFLNDINELPIWLENTRSCVPYTELRWKQRCNPKHVTEVATVHCPDPDYPDSEHFTVDAQEIFPGLSIRIDK